jgi:hypothetical protein
MVPEIVPAVVAGSVIPRMTSTLRDEAVLPTATLVVVVAPDGRAVSARIVVAVERSQVPRNAGLAGVYDGAALLR